MHLVMIIFSSFYHLKLIRLLKYQELFIKFLYLNDQVTFYHNSPLFFISWINCILCSFIPYLSYCWICNKSIALFQMRLNQIVTISFVLKSSFQLLGRFDFLYQQLYLKLSNIPLVLFASFDVQSNLWISLKFHASAIIRFEVNFQLICYLKFLMLVSKH